MPRRKRARRLGMTAGSWSLARGAALLLLASSCGFPRYDFHPDEPPSAGAGSGAGAGAPSGGAPMGGGTAADGGAPDAQGGGSAGGSVVGGDAGMPGVDCVWPEPLHYPDHCFDQVQGDGESAIDCGGGDCSACGGTQTCNVSADCLSGKCNAGKCVQVFDVKYNTLTSSPTTRSPKFHLVLTYLDSDQVPLNKLRIRYYFNHNNVTEPVLGLSSQTTFDPGGSQMDISTDVHAQVYRTLLGPASPKNGRFTDSYIEVSFDSAFYVMNQTKLDVTQDFTASSDDVSFQQTSHYSFAAVTNGTSANDTITIYKGDQRIWGIEPPWVELPECAFAAGVNVNGPALNVSGQPLAASSDAALTFQGGSDYANAKATAFPTTDDPTTELLTTARTLSGGATGTWPVPNGNYYAFAWLTAAANTDSGTLVIQGTPADKFYGMTKNNAPVWALLGPYEVSVSDQSLSLAVSDGFAHLAGLALYHRPN